MKRVEVMGMLMAFWLCDRRRVGRVGGLVLYGLSGDGVAADWLAFVAPEIRRDRRLQACCWHFS